MAHIAEEVVIENYHLDSYTILHDGAEFLNGHLEAAVATEQADLAVGSGDLGAYGGREAEAHSSEAARGDETARPGKSEIAGRHHLVLTYIGDCHGFAARSLADTGDHLSHSEPGA